MESANMARTTLLVNGVQMKLADFSAKKRLIVEHDLNLAGTYITTLSRGLKIKGSLLFRGVLDPNLSRQERKAIEIPQPDNMEILVLPEDLEVWGDLMVEGAYITELPEELEIGRNLNLAGVNVNVLPDGLKIGGNLNLTGSNIIVLPNGLEVGGNLNLVGTAVPPIPRGILVKGKVIR